MLLLCEMNGSLSPRHLDVLRCAANGLSNKAIARQLGISRHTVDFYFREAFQRLGVRNRMQAVLKAVDNGQLKVSPQEPPIAAA